MSNFEQHHDAENLEQNTAPAPSGIGLDSAPEAIEPANAIQWAKNYLAHSVVLTRPDLQEQLLQNDELIALIAFWYEQGNVDMVRTLALSQAEGDWARSKQKVHEYIKNIQADRKTEFERIARELRQYRENKELFDNSFVGKAAAKLAEFLKWVGTAAAVASAGSAKAEASVGQTADTQFHRSMEGLRLGEQAGVGISVNDFYDTNKENLKTDPIVDRARELCEPVMDDHAEYGLDDAVRIQRELGERIADIVDFLSAKPNHPKKQDTNESILKAQYPGTYSKITAAKQKFEEQQKTIGGRIEQLGVQLGAARGALIRAQESLITAQTAHDNAVKEIKSLQEQLNIAEQAVSEEKAKAGNKIDKKDQLAITTKQSAVNGLKGNIKTQQGIVDALAIAKAAVAEVQNKIKVIKEGGSSYGVDSIGDTEEAFGVDDAQTQLDQLMGDILDVDGMYRNDQGQGASQAWGEVGLIGIRIAQIDGALADSTFTDALTPVEVAGLRAKKESLQGQKARAQAAALAFEKSATDAASQEITAQAKEDARADKAAEAEDRLAEAQGRVAIKKVLDNRQKPESYSGKDIRNAKRHEKASGHERNAAQNDMYAASYDDIAAAHRAIEEEYNKGEDADIDRIMKLKATIPQSQRTPLEDQIAEILSSDKTKGQKKMALKALFTAQQFQTSAIGRGSGLRVGALSNDPGFGRTKVAESSKTTTTRDTVESILHQGLERDRFGPGYVKPDQSVSSAEGYWAHSYAKYMGYAEATNPKTDQQGAQRLSEIMHRNDVFGHDWYYTIRENWANTGYMARYHGSKKDADLQVYFQRVIDKAAKSANPDTELAQIGLKIAGFSGMVTICAIKKDANGNIIRLYERRKALSGELFVINDEGDIVGSLWCCNPSIIIPETMSETERTIIINNNTVTVNEAEYEKLVQYAVPQTEYVFINSGRVQQASVSVGVGINMNFVRCGARTIVVPETRVRDVVKQGQGNNSTRGPRNASGQQNGDTVPGTLKGGRGN